MKRCISIPRFAATFGILCGILALGSTPATAQVGSWTTGSITTNGDTNNFVSVTTDSSGNFHDAWRPESGSAGFIQIGSWNGASWTTVSSFDTSSDSPSIFDSLSDDVSLAVYSVGDFHVAFRASRAGGVTSTRGVFYARYDVSTATWSFEEVETGSHPSGWRNWDDPAIDVDSSDQPHMSFGFSNADDAISPPRPQAIRYAVRSGGSWTISDIDNTNCSTGDCFELDNFGFALDSANRAHIVYGEERGDVYDADLMYATNVSGSFATQVLRDVGDGVSDGDGVGDADIELDGSDNVQISYSLGGFSASSVQYITNASGSFVDSTARSSGMHGSPNSIGVNGTADLRVIAYRDRSDTDNDGRVRAATRSGSDAWQDESVWDDSGDDFGTGSYMDAIMNSNGQIMILFHRNSDDTGDDRRVMYAFGSLGAGAAAVCGNGTVEAGEACDDGNTSNGDCCSSSCTFESSGSSCGSGATACSGQDTCDGAGTCLANDFGAGTACGDTGTECVVQDTCNGSGSCTDNGFIAVGTNCGSSATECSGQDTCDGAGACLANDLGAGTACGDAGTECVVQDTCNGSGTCMDNGFIAAGTNCGSAATECSGQDTCNGAGTCLANDLGAGTACGDTGTECIVQDTCNGVGSCTDNGFVAAGTACGDSSATTCDLADTCSGAGSCDDNLAADGTSCDDSDACSTVDTCAAGLCVGGPDATDPTISCAGINPARTSDTDVCGFTMADTGFNPTFSDNCTGATVSNNFNTSSSLAGATFNVGTTPVTWTVTDGAGATASCSVNIAITDDQNPAITCPEDIVSAPVDSSGAPITFDDPVISDNCPDPTVACVPTSGSLFPFGDTSVACISTDASTNQNSCTFRVTVRSGTCGGFDVFETAPGVFQAPGFVGTVIVGSDQSDDVISGTNGPDPILGLAGSDSIDGGSGNDVICGGAGADSILGQGDQDILYGEEDNDWLQGGRGNDQLIGGAGTDSCFGGAGTDTTAECE